MKGKRFLLSLVEKAIRDSFIEGKLNEKTVAAFVKEFRNYPRSQALFMLTNYLKRIKQILNQTTLTIFSSIPLEDNQEKKILETFKEKYSVNSVKTEIDPGLLAGLKVKIGDDLFNTSVSRKIEELREAIAQ